MVLLYLNNKKPTREFNIASTNIISNLDNYKCNELRLKQKKAKYFYSQVSFYETRGVKTKLQFPFTANNNLKKYRYNDKCN